MDARAILTAVRDGTPLKDEDLSWFANGLSDGFISDAQAGAFAMGVFLNGLGDAGRVGLTLAMRDTGTVMQWGLDRPILDKHSTGGVGDCVSLVLAPALAACGAYVPMISGRGLGHTGGTLDKLASIPGVQTELEEDRFRQTVVTAGCAIVSASSKIAPADKRLYAIRDVTGTVESLDLITASILSKKLAGGLDGLVLDVKVGSGAFMKDIHQARQLAQALVQTANAAGCPTSAVITDMNQPMADCLGNALEVAAAMRVLTGVDQGALRDLSAVLGGVVLANPGLTPDVQTGAERMIEAIESGAAAEHFGKMIAAQGGPVRFVEAWQRFLPEAPVIKEIPSISEGYISAIDGHMLGLAVVDLGGGRHRESDTLDLAVGLSDVVRLGAWVDKGAPLARVFASRVEDASRAAKAIQSAITISDTKPEAPMLIHERVDA